MAQDNLDLVNWFNRYLVQAADMNQMETTLEGLVRGRFEGLAGKCVLIGGASNLAPTGLNTPVDACLAVGPTGNFMLTTGMINVVHTAPTGTLPQKNLVVIRPNLINENYITDPTNPFNTVPLNTRQSGQIVLLQGTPAAQPVYAATGANDVVLFGVTVSPGQTTFVTPQDLDREIRDVWAKNSSTQKTSMKYDDRCRPYYFSNTQIGVKPSQTTGTHPLGFTYIAGGTPNKFPQTSGGVYNGAAGDTIVNFATGVISGADGLSTAFTPQVPTAGNYIVATLSLNASGTLSVVYGTIGTKLQCYTAIQNATTAGAGSVSYETNKMKLAYVLIASDNGTTIRDIYPYDARSTLSYATEGQDLLTIDTAPAGKTVASGTSLIYGKLIIPVGQTWSVAGSLFVMSTLTVNGTLNTTGLTRLI